MHHPAPLSVVVKSCPNVIPVILGEKYKENAIILDATANIVAQ